MSNNFDFEYLSKLYVAEPEKFEELRAKEIENLIQSASVENQNRLRGLQFQIDAKRKIHKDSPIGACMAISKMMHESFENLRFHLNQFSNRKDPLGHRSIHDDVNNYHNKSPAKVLQFRS